MVCGRTFAVGAHFVLVVFVAAAIAVAFFGVPIVAVVQVATTPDEDFRAVGSNKTTWLLVIVLGWFLCGIAGVIAAFVWLLSERPKVLAHQARVGRVGQRAAPPAPVSPPGWFPDPSGRHERRYWDGARWTEHVADGQTTATDPV
jgi:hypothetical protein